MALKHAAPQKNARSHSQTIRAPSFRSSFSFPEISSIPKQRFRAGGCFCYKFELIALCGRETLRVHQRSTRWRRARRAAYELMWILNSPVDASRLEFQTKLCRYFTKIANAIGARAPAKATRAPTTLLINCYDLAINVRNWRFSAQLALMCWRRVVVRQSGLSKADLMCWGKGRR